jgi:hypothetical protein
MTDPKEDGKQEALGKADEKKQDEKKEGSDEELADGGVAKPKHRLLSPIVPEHKRFKQFKTELFELARNS